MQIKVQKKDLQILLLSLEKLSDTCILSLNKNGIHAIAAAGDNSMYILVSMKGVYEDVTLNLPSLKKLTKALSLVPTDDVALNLNRNHLEYKGKEIKFKYHLHEDGVLTKPKLNRDKIMGFEYDIEFDLDLATLSKLLQNASFTNTKKVYIYTDNGNLMWKLTDETAANTDVLCVTGDEVDFKLEPFILNIDNLKNVTAISKEDAKFKINSKIGIGNIILNRGDLEINYIFSSLTK